MDLSEFKASIQKGQIPDGLTVYLHALWLDGKGDWNKAHSLIDHLEDADAAFLHAYLHRKEGDLGNASYWYRRAGKTKPNIGLAEEWEQMVLYFLEKMKE
jgi:hypothetical protein|tara:strand:+ start:261 stop:560 length:300 start_codon:yes stop_codon:yes gene_type:complete